MRAGNRLAWRVITRISRRVAPVAHLVSFLLREGHFVVVVASNLL
jgi:hypothetical protein